MTSSNRRQFLRDSAKTIAAAATVTVLARHGKAEPSERINLCLVGVRGRGRGVAANFAKLKNCQITHLCDVNEETFAPVSKAISDIQKTTPKNETDLRRVLQDKSVDGLIVATPDHWHALATIWGCQARKHVYVEKPISHNIFEGHQMVAAARKHKCIVQVGTQSRSVPHYIEAIDFVRSGKIGKVHMAKAWNSQVRGPVSAKPDAAVPAGLNWDIWQGPAPERPFNANRYTGAWRWMWEYGTGDMGNDGVHDLDIARWGLDVGFPSRVSGTGIKVDYPGDIRETPDTQIVNFEFPGTKKVLVYEMRLWSPYYQEGYENGVAFYGTEGYVLIGRRSWSVTMRGNKHVPQKSPGFSDIPHCENFLACIKDGKRPNCDIEDGHYSTTLAHLGNILYRVGRPLVFDPKTETIVGDDEAAKMVKRKGRKEFVIPDEV